MKIQKSKKEEGQPTIDRHGGKFECNWCGHNPGEIFLTLEKYVVTDNPDSRFIFCCYEHLEKWLGWFKKNYQKRKWKRWVE